MALARIAGGFVVAVAMLTALWVPGFARDRRANDRAGAISDTVGTQTASQDSADRSGPDSSITDPANGPANDVTSTYVQGSGDPASADLAPAAREGESTALLEAMPDLVGNFVQVGVSSWDRWMDEHGAGEAWTIWYTDAVDSPAVRLDVGQWAGQSHAESFAQAQMLVAGSSIRSGEVRVGATQVGTYALFAAGDQSIADTFVSLSDANANVHAGADADAGSNVYAGTDVGVDADAGASIGENPGAGQGAGLGADHASASSDAVLWWRNGTAVFRLTGPVDVIQALYVAFPF